MTRDQTRFVAVWLVACVLIGVACGLASWPWAYLGVLPFQTFAYWRAFSRLATPRPIFAGLVSVDGYLRRERDAR